MIIIAAPECFPFGWMRWWRGWELMDLSCSLRMHGRRTTNKCALCWRAFFCDGFFSDSVSVWDSKLSSWPFSPLSGHSTGRRYALSKTRGVCNTHCNSPHSEYVGMNWKTEKNAVSADSIHQFDSQFYFYNDSKRYFSSLAWIFVGIIVPISYRATWRFCVRYSPTSAAFCIASTRWMNTPIIYI